MTIIIDGTGTISGVSATGLTTAQTVGYSSLPAGSVLQVVSATANTIGTNTSTTLVDTGLTATITPKFATSKIFVTVSQVLGVSRNDPYQAAQLTIARNGTTLNFVVWDKLLNGTRDEMEASPSAISYLDSPATTSAVVYKTQYGCWHGNSGERAYINNRNAVATITLMEIAA
jgi:hypothetical protein